MKRVFTAIACCIIASEIGILLLLPKVRSYPFHADVVIFSPHPDDAVLGFGGIIQQKIAAGKSVLVVDVTNGDDFTDHAAALFHKPIASLTPRDMIRFARIRQREELMAMKVLGVPSSHVLFLAYPDGMLPDLYTATRAAVYHKATNTYQTYKASLPDYHFLIHGTHAPYTKLSAEDDIAEIIRDTQPSEIYTTGPLDDAGDHEAVYRFIRDAMRPGTALYTTVIHAPDWPSPIGITPGLPYDVPKSLPGALRIPLTQLQVAKKLSAIDQYNSELLLRDFPLSWFIKSDEVVWQEPN